MNISEERWAKMIEEVRLVSEANNTRREEDLSHNIFEIVSNGYDSYKWRYLENDSWVESASCYDSKGACLANFITEIANISIAW